MTEILDTHNLMDKFLGKFYSENELKDKVRKQPNFIKKYSIPSNDKISINKFLYRIGDLIYRSRGENIREYEEFSKKYCNYINSVEVNNSFSFNSTKFNEISDEIAELWHNLTLLKIEEGLKEEKIEIEAEKKYKKYYSNDPEIVAAKLDEFMTDYYDDEILVKKTALREQINEKEKEKQNLRDISLAAKVKDAQVTCDKAVKSKSGFMEDKTSYNMEIGEKQHAPSIYSDSDMIRKMIKSFHQIDPVGINQHSTTRCEGKYYHIISGKSMDNSKNNLKASTNKIFDIEKAAVEIENDIKNNHDEFGCISFNNIYRIPLTYPWLDKSLYTMLDLEKNHKDIILPNEENATYRFFKDFQTQYCLVPTAAIVAIKPTIYINLKKANEYQLGLEGQFKTKLYQLFNIDLDSQNAWKDDKENNEEFFLHEAKDVVVIAHEFENNCKLYEESTIYNHEEF